MLIIDAILPFCHLNGNEKRIDKKYIKDNNTAKGGLRHGSRKSDKRRTAISFPQPNKHGGADQQRQGTWCADGRGRLPSHPQQHPTLATITNRRNHHLP